MYVTIHLKQPTQTPCGLHVTTQRIAWISIWSCSWWGFPCHDCCQSCGALLPHHFTLTSIQLNPKVKRSKGGIFSVALSVDLRLPGVTWHLARWSPDFPLFTQRLSSLLLNLRIRWIQFFSYIYLTVSPTAKDFIQYLRVTTFQPSF
jgi:hypothetical protein